jgi:hypothetical protein
MDKQLYARARALFIGALALSVATLAAAAAFGGNTAVWVRGAIVTVIATLLISLAKRAFGGSRAAYRRMRLMTTIAPVAVVVIVALPHDGFPTWMKVEQAAVGLLLATAAVMLGHIPVQRAYREPAQPSR